MTGWRLCAAAAAALIAIPVALWAGAGLLACLGTGLLAGAALLHVPSPRAGATVLVFALGLTLAGGELQAPAAVLLGFNAFGVGRSSGGALRVGTAILLLGGAVARVHADEFAVDIFLVLTPLIAGWALSGRDVVARQLAERGAELEAERDVFAELSVRYERARIAAELHDIVAHAIAVMVVQAGAGQRLARVDPVRTEAAFAAIAGAARHAEADMAHLTALLTDAGEHAPDADLRLVRELVGRAAATGLDVTLRLKGERGLLASEASRSAYLVVREGLTNALRYAAGAPIRVLVDGRRDVLLVEVVNGPALSSASAAGSGSGRGLQGLRERLDAWGGRLDAGPTHESGWRLRAELPRRVAVAHPAGVGGAR